MSSTLTGAWQARLAWLSLLDGQQPATTSTSACKLQSPWRPTVFITLTYLITPSSCWPSPHVTSPIIGCCYHCWMYLSPRRCYLSILGFSCSWNAKVRCYTIFVSAFLFSFFLFFWTPFCNLYVFLSSGCFHSHYMSCPSTFGLSDIFYNVFNFAFISDGGIVNFTLSCSVL